MKKKIQNQITILNQVYELMEENLELWSGIEKLKADYDALVLNKHKIEKLVAIAEKDHSAEMEKLAQLKISILDKLIPVSNLLDLYARDEKKSKLQKMIKTSRGSLDELSTTQLASYAIKLADYVEKKINKESENKEENIGSYGLNESLLNELRKDVETYISLHAKIKDEKKAGEDAKREIIKRQRENQKLLHKRISKFISVFETQNPDFHTAFKNALKIDEENKVTDKAPNPDPQNSPAKETIPPVEKPPIQKRTSPVGRPRKSPTRKTSSPRASGAKAGQTPATRTKTGGSPE